MNRMLQIYGTSNDWINNQDKILSQGEIGVEITPEGETLIKIGDGVTTYGNLSYAKTQSGDVIGLNDLLDAKSDITHNHVIILTQAEYDALEADDNIDPTKIYSISDATANTETGPQGPAGLSAYQVWLELGNTGTEVDFLEAYRGNPGITGDHTSLTSSEGLVDTYTTWADSAETQSLGTFTVTNGKSAYDIWKDAGNIGTEQDFIDSLTGPAGPTGPDGKSAYEVWLDAGNTGTEQDFFDSIGSSDNSGGTGTVDSEEFDMVKNRLNTYILLNDIANDPNILEGAVRHYDDGDDPTLIKSGDTLSVPYTPSVLSKNTTVVVQSSEALDGHYNGIDVDVILEEQNCTIPNTAYDIPYPYLDDADNIVYSDSIKVPKAIFDKHINESDVDITASENTSYAAYIMQDTTTGWYSDSGASDAQIDIIFKDTAVQKTCTGLSVLLPYDTEDDLWSTVNQSLPETLKCDLILEDDSTLTVYDGEFPGLCNIIAWDYAENIKGIRLYLSAPNAPDDWGIGKTLFYVNERVLIGQPFSQYKINGIIQNSPVVLKNKISNVELLSGEDISKSVGLICYDSENNKLTNITQTEELPPGEGFVANSHVELDKDVKHNCFVTDDYLANNANCQHVNDNIIIKHYSGFRIYNESNYNGTPLSYDQSVSYYGNGNINTFAANENYIICGDNSYNDSDGLIMVLYGSSYGSSFTIENVRDLENASTEDYAGVGMHVTIGPTVNGTCYCAITDGSYYGNVWYAQMTDTLQAGDFININCPVGHWGSDAIVAIDDVTGTLLAARTSGSDKGKVFIIDVTTGNVVHTIDYPGTDSSKGDFGKKLVFSGNKLIISAPDDEVTSNSDVSGAVYIYDLDTETITLIAPPIDDYSDYDFTPYGVHFGSGISKIVNDKLVIGVTNLSLVGAESWDDPGALFIYDVTSAAIVDMILPSLDNTTSDYMGDTVLHTEYGIYTNVKYNSSDYGVYVAPYATITNVHLTKNKYFDEPIATPVSVNLDEFITPPGTYYSKLSGTFGKATAESGNLVFVGGPYARTDISDSSTDYGEVFVYDKTTGVMSVLDHGIPATKQDRSGFGCALAADGDKLVIGAKYTQDGDSNSAGAVYVYEISSSTTTKLPLPTTDIRYCGTIVDISGDNIVIKAYDANNNIHIWLYNMVSETYTEIVPTDGTDSGFATAIVMEGDYVIINQHEKTGYVPYTDGSTHHKYYYGRIWIYNISTQTLSYEYPLYDSAFGYSYQHFGTSLAIHKGVVYLTSQCPGSIVVTYKLDTQEWDKFIMPSTIGDNDDIVLSEFDRDDSFSYAISVNDSNIVISNPDTSGMYTTNTGNESYRDHGNAFVIDKATNTWTIIEQYVSENYRFGASLLASNDENKLYVCGYSSSSITSYGPIGFGMFKYDIEKYTSNVYPAHHINNSKIFIGNVSAPDANNWYEYLKLTNNTDDVIKIDKVAIYAKS